NTVTMVPIGNVSLQNLGNARSNFVAADASVSRRNGAQIFTQPNQPTDEYLCWGCAVRVVGRSGDEYWLLILGEDDTSAWVATSDIETVFVFSLLPVIEGDEAIDPPYVGSMQAMTLISGIDDAPCAGAPESGLLVQSPDLDHEAYLIVNGLD